MSFPSAGSYLHCDDREYANVHRKGSDRTYNCAGLEGELGHAIGVACGKRVLHLLYLRIRSLLDVYEAHVGAVSSCMVSDLSR